MFDACACLHFLNVSDSLSFFVKISFNFSKDTLNVTIESNYWRAMWANVHIKITKATLTCRCSLGTAFMRPIKDVLSTANHIPTASTTEPASWKSATTYHFHKVLIVVISRIRCTNLSQLLTFSKQHRSDWHCTVLHQYIFKWSWKCKLELISFLHE